MKLVFSKINDNTLLLQFRSIEPIQRESIIKALNEDTQKLLNEGSSDDPALKRLQEEIAYCNKLFADLQRMLDQDEGKLA